MFNTIRAFFASPGVVALEARINELENQVDSLEKELEDKADVDDLDDYAEQGDLDKLDDRVDELEDDLDSKTDDKEFEKVTDALKGVTDDLESRVETLEDNADLAGTTSTLRRRITELEEQLRVANSAALLFGQGVDARLKELEKAILGSDPLGQHHGENR